MANDQDSAGAAPEKVISVDLDEVDPTKAVDRREARSEIAAGVRDDEDRGAGSPRSPIEKQIFKRMTRFSRSFDQKLAETEARFQRQVAELATENQRLRLEMAERGGGDPDHEKAIAALLEKLAAANERGDSTEAAKVTSEIARAEARFAAKASGGEVRRDAGGADPNAAAAAAAAPGARTGPTPAGQRFIRANEEWWNDPLASDAKSYAGTLYKRLTEQEGYDANSDETFEAIRRDMKRRFPEYEIRSSSAEDADDTGGDAGDAGENSQERRSRVAAAGGFQDRGAASRQSSGRNRRTLNQTDIRTMRAVGLDPDNNDHVVRFLRESQAMEA